MTCLVHRSCPGLLEMLPVAHIPTVWYGCRAPDLHTPLRSETLLEPLWLGASSHRGGS